ncbi:hypothetical protein BKA70DRAFT_1430494 [Coprinopsis sp. MPI-PUGE-AT-0042]|nr:hypothetical protein BKA70DRAFT_1430494 [Coprinopsis sp. MPI-PUGE-AT-0042]
MLEELILDSCDYSNIPLTYATPSIVNTSLRRLVATGSVLSRWRSVSFPSLQFCQLIPNTNSEFLLRWDKGYTDEVLYLIAEFLGECNAPNVTLDLTRASISPAEIASLLSSIPALRSLRLASNAAIFSNEAKHWRTKPNVKHVVCERYLPVPDTFRTIPLPRVLNGLEQAVIIHVPSDPQANKPSYFLCSEIKGMVIPSPMNLVCLPESQMAAILRDEFPIRNHEYEALRNDLDPGAL